MCQLAGDSEVTVWDIGANIGTVSLPLLATKPRIKVVAFEPSPAVCAKLLKNANLNPALQSRLKIINCALSDRTGWVEFYASNEVNNSGIGGIGVASNRVNASFMTFAQLGSNCSELVAAPDIIKIDVEGHELSVLRGLGGILNRRPLTIIFEHSIYRLKENGTPFEATSDFLREKGFKISALDGIVPVDLNKDQDLVASNVQS
jgi:FkbM family methyltransferase